MTEISNLRSEILRLQQRRNSDQSAAKEVDAGKFTIRDFSDEVDKLNEHMILIEDSLFALRGSGEYSPELNSRIFKVAQRADDLRNIAYERSWLGTKGYKRITEIRRRLHEADFLNNSYARGRTEQPEKSE